MNNSKGFLIVLVLNLKRNIFLYSQFKIGEEVCMDTPLQKTSYSLNPALTSDSEDAVRFARAKFMRVLQAWAVDRLAEKSPAACTATVNTGATAKAGDATADTATTARKAA
jgi:hypothetical protein